MKFLSFPIWGIICNSAAASRSPMMMKLMCINFSMIGVGLCFFPRAIRKVLPFGCQLDFSLVASIKLASLSVSVEVSCSSVEAAIAPLPSRNEVAERGSTAFADQAESPKVKSAAPKVHIQARSKVKCNIAE